MTTSPSCARWDAAGIRGLCLREARRVLPTDPALAEDAAQEASIRIWRAAQTCQSRDAPEPWMRSIARREALRQLRKRRELPFDDAVAEPISSTAADGDRLVVRQAIGRLSELDRVVLFMRYWRDLSQTQIAERLGLPEGTAKVRLHRARKALQHQLEDSV